MLTDTQTQVICLLSGAAVFQLALGVLVGVPVGAFIRVMRTRTFLGFLLGGLCAALPASGMTVAVSLVFTLFQLMLCQLEIKAGWDVPGWLMGIEVILILVAGVVGAFLAQRSRLTDSPPWNAHLGIAGSDGRGARVCGPRFVRATMFWSRTRDRLAAQPPALSSVVWPSCCGVRYVSGYTVEKRRQRLPKISSGESAVLSNRFIEFGHFGGRDFSFTHD